MKTSAGHMSESLYRIFTQIARREFFVETLETRNLDRLDFHDVSVGAMRDALLAAYNLGRRDAEHPEMRDEHFTAETKARALGLAVHADGQVVCPECGVAHNSEHMVCTADGRVVCDPCSLD